MNDTAKIIQPTQLKAGDILLCRGEGEGAEKIQSETGSNYTHAVICISKTEAAEVGLRVNTRLVKDIISRYPHIAAFRQPDAWDESRVLDLNLFVKRVVSSKYNVGGIRNFEANKEEHLLSIQEKLNKYFQGHYSPDPSIKKEYFCSEFVADCFVATGFISPSAAVFYKSDTISPVSLGREPTYGTFLGYLRKNEDVEIPKDDEFFKNTTFTEIFGSEASN